MNRVYLPRRFIPATERCTNANLRNRETCDRCIQRCRALGCTVQHLCEEHCSPVFTHAVAPLFQRSRPPTSTHAPLRCPCPPPLAELRHRLSRSAATLHLPLSPSRVDSVPLTPPGPSPVLLIAAEHAPSLPPPQSRVIYSTNARVPSVPPRLVPLRARNIPIPRSRLRPWLPGARQPAGRGR